MPKHEYGREGAHLQSQVFWRTLSWCGIGAAFIVWLILGLAGLRSPLACVGALFLLPPLIVVLVIQLARGASHTIAPVAKGLTGEMAVAEHLRRAVGSEGYLVHDIRIGDRGNIDHVAVLPGGIYSIETKAWEGNVFIRGDRLWVNRHEREQMLRQAFAESRAVRDYLDRVSNGWKHDVLPVLVFTRARLDAPSMCRGVWVTDLARLAPALQHHDDVLDHMQRSRIAAALGTRTAEQR